MTLKSLVTTCLLFGCLATSAQAFSTDYGHGDRFFDNQTGNFGFQGNNLYSTDNNKPWLLSAERAYISKAQAIDIARQRTNGKILSADLVRREQHAFYKIKVLTDQGRIKTLRINAQTNNR
ncbi:MAG: PepSY domain-containing protein [Pseudomonadales bacterium]